MIKCQDCIADILNDVVNTEKAMPSTLHITLSKTLYLKYLQIDSFKQALKTNILENLNPILNINAGEVTIMSNEAKTRIFIGLKVTGSLKDLVNQIDKAINEIKMGEHKFFPEPTFHITLLTVNFSEPSEDIEETKIKI